MALAGQLGCGAYTAQITTRGGGQVLGELPFADLGWGRVLDDTSLATVTLDVRATPECCEQVSQIRQWRHELNILRNDTSVWSGPFAGAPKYGWGRVELKARDLSAWFDKRFLHTDQAYVNTDLALIFSAYAADALAPDPSPSIGLTVSLCGVSGTRDVKAAEYKLCGPELRELAQNGIDWTMLGRTMLAGGLVVPTTPIATLSDDHFADAPDVQEDGMTQANRWAIVGAQAHDPVTGQFTSGFGFTGTAQSDADVADDGLLEDKAQVDQVKDNASAAAAAESRLALTRTTIPLMSGGTLRPSAPITIDQLVPGALVNVVIENTCRPIQGQYRLQSIDVSASPDEEVKVTLQPVGAQ